MNGAALDKQDRAPAPTRYLDDLSLSAGTGFRAEITAPVITKRRGIW
jgi:hypothetical protein